MDASSRAWTRVLRCRLRAEQEPDQSAHCAALPRSDVIKLQYGATLCDGRVRKSDGRHAVLCADSEKNGRPRFSWLRYCGDDGIKRYGRARAVVAAVNGEGCRRIVLERVVLADPEPNCAFTAYTSKRLRWAHEAGATTPDFEAVALDNVDEVLCVEQN